MKISNLDELLAALNAEGQPQGGTPKFGDLPSDIDPEGIISWDSSRVLIRGLAGFEIVSFAELKSIQQLNVDGRPYQAA